MKGDKFFFVDTNVLVYSKDETEPAKHQMAIRWLEFLWGSQCGRISYQVLSGYYVTVTKKLKPGRDSKLAQTDIRALLTWSPQVTTAKTLENAWQIQKENQLSWWDSLILASALEAGASYLLTEDLQEDREIGDLRVINPFKVMPESF